MVVTFTALLLRVSINSEESSCRNLKSILGLNVDRLTTCLLLCLLLPDPKWTCNLVFISCNHNTLKYCKLMACWMKKALELVYGIWRWKVWWDISSKSLKHVRCCQLYGNYPSITQVSTHHPGTNLSYSFKRRDSHANKLCLKRLESLASDFHIIHLVRETWMKSRGPSRQYYSSCNIMGYFKSSVTNHSTITNVGHEWPRYSIRYFRLKL